MNFIGILITILLLSWFIRLILALVIINKISKSVDNRFNELYNQAPDERAQKDVIIDYYHLNLEISVETVIKDILNPLRPLNGYNWISNDIKRYLNV